jgi:hypothetical protein
VDRELARALDHARHAPRPRRLHLVRRPPNLHLSRHELTSWLQ